MFNDTRGGPSLSVGSLAIRERSSRTPENDSFNEDPVEEDRASQSAACALQGPEFAFMSPDLFASTDAVGFERKQAVDSRTPSEECYFSPLTFTEDEEQLHGETGMSFADLVDSNLSKRSQFPIQVTSADLAVGMKRLTRDERQTLMIPPAIHSTRLSRTQWLWHPFRNRWKCYNKAFRA